MNKIILPTSGNLHTPEIVERSSINLSFDFPKNE